MCAIRRYNVFMSFWRNMNSATVFRSKSWIDAIFNFFRNWRTLLNQFVPHRSKQVVVLRSDEGGGWGTKSQFNSFKVSLTTFVVHSSAFSRNETTFLYLWTHSVRFMINGLSNVRSLSVAGHINHFTQFEKCIINNILWFHQIQSMFSF